MTTLHLRKVNNPCSSPHVVDWICDFNKSEICTSCFLINGKPSIAFLGMPLSFVDQWVAIGTLDGIEYHQIVETID